MAFYQIHELRKDGNSPLKMIKQIFSQEEITDLKGITIVSAFTDVFLIGHLLKEVHKSFPPKFLLRVLLDQGASGYHRDPQITNHLNKHAGKMKKMDLSADSGIFVVNLGRFLHSKVVLLHFPNSHAVSLGSLNFTYRGFTSNEEIQVHLQNEKDINDVLNYVTYLFNHDRCVQLPFAKGKEKNVTSSPREWLLKGRLFFEDKVSNPYNFKLGLPEELRKQPAFVIPGEEAEVADSVSIRSLLGIPKARHTLGWKSFCIATCYGYWCPAQLVREAKKKIDSAVAARRKTVVDEILGNGPQLKKKFHAIFDEIEKNVMRWNKENGTRFTWEKDHAQKRLERWLPSVLSKLEDKKNQDRLLAGVDEAVVPDLWSGDEIAVRDFEESFCAHIVIDMAKAKVNNYPVQWLRDCYEFTEGLELGDSWDESWDDEDAWLTWLHSCAEDPFEKLPREWGLK